MVSVPVVPITYSSEVICIEVYGWLPSGACEHWVFWFCHSDDDWNWHFADGVPCPGGIFSANQTLFLLMAVWLRELSVSFLYLRLHLLPFSGLWHKRNHKPGKHFLLSFRIPLIISSFYSRTRIYSGAHFNYLPLQLVGYSLALTKNLT